MSRSVVYGLLVAAFAAAGLLAYSMGRLLAPGPELAGTELQSPPTLEEPLVGADGSARTLAEIAAAGGDDALLVFFGYTRCPDVCPLTLSRVAAAYRALGEPERVGVVMITVDPENDTPELVQRYAGGFHPDFVGLSGDSGAIARAAKTFYIGVQQAPDGLVNHTDALVVVDRQGRMRWVYGQPDLGALERDIPQLLDAL